jgi:hypothetical protein
MSGRERLTDGVVPTTGERGFTVVTNYLTAAVWIGAD